MLWRGIRLLLHIDRDMTHFFITSNDRFFGCPIIYTDTLHNVILAIGNSAMLDTTTPIH